MVGVIPLGNVTPLHGIQLKAAARWFILVGRRRGQRERWNSKSQSQAVEC